MDKKNIFEKKPEGKKVLFYILMAACVLTIAAISFVSYKSVQNSIGEEKIYNSSESTDKVDTQLENVTEKTEPEEEKVTVQETKPENNNENVTVESKAYIMPLDSSEITTGFSLTEPVYSKTLKDWRIHDGIDISAPLGEKVVAVNDGLIETIENGDLYGITVIIKHTDGKNSTYCNLEDNIELEEGQIINQGDIIGKIGESAVFEISEGPHLHFEMSENGKKIDPLSVIKVQE